MVETSGTIVNGAEDIRLSPRAAKRILKVLAGEPEKSVLRVSVSGGGCSGFQYGFDLDAAPAADDLVLTTDGATVVIDPMSVEFLKGSEIDFVDDLMGAAFQIRNPNAKSSCGCGTSFSL